ncbi:MAG: hypothetical protein OXC62_03850 [Aestuariivita sp.]|nr:hypothetical protein [Aestuariivita sp.]
MKQRVVTLAAALVAMLMSAPVMAQNIQDAASRSSVLDNTAKGITNGSILLSAIPGSTSMALPIKSTGYYGGSGVDGFIGTLGLGNEGWLRRCPFVNAYRQETTYTPGQSFGIQDCNIYVEGGERLSNFWVGIRVYGMICSATSPTDCQDLRNALDNPEQYETDGYTALLKPGPECGPAKWPTEELWKAGAPGYAEWCDFGIKVP